jgi:hypothetical protein
MATRKNKPQKPVPARPPFDRKDALRRLIVWHGLMSGTIERLFHVAQDLAHELGRTPELRELIDDRAVQEIYCGLERLTCATCNCAPKTLGELEDVCRF